MDTYLTVKNDSAPSSVHRPLLWACWAGQLAAAKWLVAADRGCVADTSLCGDGPLTVAAQSGQQAVVCRGAWARVTINQFRHLALQTC